MKDIDDGGSAFPLPDGCTNDRTGMTLRDYFAAKAMHAGLVTITEFPDADENCRYGLALDAYATADAMLKARATP